MVRSILYLAFRQAARWHQPWVAALLLHLVSRRLPTYTAKGNRIRRRYRALIMARAGFAQDIQDSFRTDDAFELIAWPSFALKAFSAALLAPSLDHNYYISSDPTIEETKRNYRDFLAATWRQFSTLRPVTVVLTGNFGYCAEREFGTVLEAAGTPFIALHKENVRPPKRVKEYWHAIYKERRGKFTGRKILVYNAIERDLEISSGIIDPESVIVTGMPRLDRVHKWRRDHAGLANRSGRPLILFFAFSRFDKLTAIQRKPSAGLPGDVEEMEGDWGKLSWEHLCDQIHRAIVEVARMRPDFHVVIKTKGQSRSQPEILRSLRATENPLPPNLELIAGGDPFQLITESCAVVGFNTTGLLEAVAAGKPVIVPYFAEACAPSRRDLIIDLGDAVSRAHSPEELIQMICQFADAPLPVPQTLPEASLQALRYWVGNDDGAAGHRVLEAIRNEVERSVVSGRRIAYSDTSPDANAEPPTPLALPSQQ